MAKLGKLKKRLNVMQSQLDCVTEELKLLLEYQRGGLSFCLSSHDAMLIRRWQLAKRKSRDRTKTA